MWLICILIFNTQIIEIQVNSPRLYVEAAHTHVHVHVCAASMLKKTTSKRAEEWHSSSSLAMPNLQSVCIKLAPEPSICKSCHQKYVFLHGLQQLNS